jgi:hypothetical protein
LWNSLLCLKKKKAITKHGINTRTVPAIFESFVNPLKEVVRAQIFWRMEVCVWGGARVGVEMGVRSSIRLNLDTNV